MIVMKIVKMIVKMIVRMITWRGRNTPAAIIFWRLASVGSQLSNQFGNNDLNKYMPVIKR